MTTLLNLYPELTIYISLHHLPALLTQNSPNSQSNDYRNEEGYVTVMSKSYRELDAWVVLFESVTKALKMNVLRESVGSENIPSVSASLQSILDALLAYNPADPLLCCRRLAGKGYQGY